MCSGVEIAMIASAVVGTGTAIYSGQVQKETAEVNAELQRREGDAARDAAVAQAEKIRKAGAAQASQANAALAASGVAVGEGTPLRINENIYQNAEDDAYSTLLTGKRQQQAANDSAGMLEYQGNAAQTVGYLNAASTVLSTAASYGQWKTSQATAKTKAGG